MPIERAIERRVSLLGPLTLVARLDLQEAGKALESLQERLRDTRPLFTEAGVIFRRSFARNFAEGGRPAWAPLKESTVRQKAALIKAGKIPPRTKSGRVPPRLTQRDPLTGQRTFGAGTILIRTGALRDSWCQKDARGNVEDIGDRGAFYGSQLTIERPVTLRTVRPYHLLTRKGAAILARTGELRPQKGTRGAQVPLAAFHEEGTSRMVARPVGVVQDEDLDALAAAGVAWVTGGGT